MGDVSGLGVGGNHDHRHPESAPISATRLGTVRPTQHSRRDVVVPAAPVLPDKEDRGIRPVGTVAGRVNDRSYIGGDPSLVKAWSDSRPLGMTQLTVVRLPLLISVKTGTGFCEVVSTMLLTQSDPVHA